MIDNHPLSPYVALRPDVAAFLTTNIASSRREDGWLVSDAIMGVARAGIIAHHAMTIALDSCLPGVAGEDIDALVADFVAQQGGLMAPLSYKGFPGSLCLSINHVMCHGIPSSKRLKAGDIASVDITVILDGWHADLCRSVMVPLDAGSRADAYGRMHAPSNVDSGLRQRVIETARQATEKGIECARAGLHLGGIGHAIATYVRGQGMQASREFCGHGIGRQFHESPEVLNFGRPEEGEMLKAGMIFTVEPIVCVGKASSLILADGWTAISRDRRPSAQFEDTIIITEQGPPIILTRPYPLSQSLSQPSIQPLPIVS